MVGLGFLFCLGHLGGQRPRIRPIEIIGEFFLKQGPGGRPLPTHNLLELLGNYRFGGQKCDFAFFGCVSILKLD